MFKYRYRFLKERYYDHVTGVWLSLCISYECKIPEVVHVVLLVGLDSSKLLCSGLGAMETCFCFRPAHDNCHYTRVSCVTWVSCVTRVSCVTL